MEERQINTRQVDFSRQTILNVFDDLESKIAAGL